MSEHIPVHQIAKTTHSSPSRASYGSSIASILENIDCDITVLHWMVQTFLLHSIILYMHISHMRSVFVLLLMGPTTSGPGIFQGIIPQVHYSDVIMGAMASQITSLTIVYSTVYSGGDKKQTKLRSAGLWAGNSPVIGEFHTQMTSNAKNVSIWWRHYGWIWKTMRISCRWIRRIITALNHIQAWL